MALQARNVSGAFKKRAPGQFESGLVSYVVLALLREFFSGFSTFRLS